MAPRAVVVGAGSGIGLALARRLDRAGYELGLTHLEPAPLEAARRGLSNRTWTRAFDLRALPDAISAIDALMDAMGGVDLFVASAGVNRPNEALAWEPELETVQVNILGFLAMCHRAIERFRRQGTGHLVGISSFSEIRGTPWSPAYGASKAFVSNYLQGIRAELEGRGISVTDVRPGFVDTPMTAGVRARRLIVSTESAAEGIFDAIRRRRRTAYVPRTWALAAWPYRLLPESLFHRLLVRRSGARPPGPA